MEQHFTTGDCGRGISVISWVNNKEMYQQMLLPSFMYGLQIEAWDVEAIVISPNAGCTNMGQAYNLGRERAKYPTKIYAHQDVRIGDRAFTAKLNVLLNQPQIGVIGMVGSTVDSGACFYHGPDEATVGMHRRMWWPEARQVQIVDCFLFATRLDIPFSEEYEGPHMVAEDYCMRARAAGYQIWIIDSPAEHVSGGHQDEGFYRSVHTFRRKWKHMLPPRAEMVTFERMRRAHIPAIYDTNVEVLVL